DRVSARTAAEALVALARRVDVEARRPLAVKGTEALVVHPRAAKVDVATDEIDDVDPVPDLLDLLVWNARHASWGGGPGRRRACPVRPSVAGSFVSPAIGSRPRPLASVRI